MGHALLFIECLLILLLLKTGDLNLIIWQLWRLDSISSPWFAIFVNVFVIVVLVAVGCICVKHQMED